MILSNLYNLLIFNIYYYLIIFSKMNLADPDFFMNQFHKIDKHNYNGLDNKYLPVPTFLLEFMDLPEGTLVSRRYAHMKICNYIKNEKDINVDIVLKYPRGKNALCGICLEKSTHICSVCKSRYYCSLNCQKKDWKLHKKVCKAPTSPFTRKGFKIIGKLKPLFDGIESLMRERGLLEGKSMPTELLYTQIREYITHCFINVNEYVT